MARFEGNKSWQKLFRTTYGKNILGALANATGADDGIKNFPLSFPYSSSYAYNTGRIIGRGGVAYYWGKYIGGENTARSLAFYSTNFNPQNNSLRVQGFSLRCVAQACY